MANAQSKATLIYVGDPMCSWCYGFAPELSKTVETLGEEVDLELLMGGLRPYNKETMQELSDFLTEHWEHVHEKSGQKFNYSVLKEDWLYDTEPPSRATMVVRQLAPEKEFAYFKAIQKAFYEDNKNPNIVETYLELAESFDIDTKQFRILYESDELKTKTRQDFLRSNELGVRGFPSMILNTGDKYYLISNGYMDSESLVGKVRGLINN